MGGSGFLGSTDFTAWLADQAGREDRVGAFARTAADDPNWPRRRTTLLAFVEYLCERDGRNFCREELVVRQS